MNVVVLKNIKKIYGKDTSKIIALNDVSLNIKKGSVTAIMGPSGCGKSTLLNIIGCIDTASYGEYYLCNNLIENNLSKLSEIRNKKISFIFQNFALVKDFTVLDNVILPLNFRKMSKFDKIKKAEYYIEKLKISNLKNKKVCQLSGGQQQRVAIARSLAQETDIILADEPTGALDEENSYNIMQILINLNSESNKTIIIVTHNPEIAKLCDTTLKMKDGKII